MRERGAETLPLGCGDPPPGVLRVGTAFRGGVACAPGGRCGLWVGLRGCEPDLCSPLN